MATDQEVAPPKPSVPWRTIWATILAVVISGAVLLLLRQISRIVTWLVIALFFATVLTPPVDFLQYKMKVRRGVAVALVMLTAIGLLTGLLYAFVAPLVEEGQDFARAVPDIVEDVREGRGTLGDVVDRYDLESVIEENQDRLQEFAQSLGTPALDAARAVFSAIVAFITILVLTVLLLLRGPSMGNRLFHFFPDRHQERARAVAVDSGRAVSGYIFGNLLISLIAGTATWIVLLVLDVPYAEVLGLWVGFADLIPLIGATLGAIPTIGFAFLHSTSAGIISVIFFIAYQQFENHVLQVAIMSRTVRINPLGVLVSVLVGVELFGLLGALLAIPGAGVIQVVIRDLFDVQRGRLKAEPTVGADETPVGELT